MPAHNPEELYSLFREAFERGPAGLEDLVALYEPWAQFVPGPGQAVSGTEAIRRAYAEILTVKPKLTVLAKKVLATDEVVLSCHKWVMKGTGSDGQPTEVDGLSAEVARRQPDGTWLFAIDNPYGTD